jgi:hypothetical protein
VTLARPQSTARGPAAGRSTPRAVGHPLIEARAEQEASALNSELAELVYQAIIDRLEKTGTVFVDDLEGYFPAEHRDRCRNLVPGQLGSFRGRHYIQPTSEYRKSAVPARKGGKSWVYEFTQTGREKLAGVSAGEGPSEKALASPPHSDPEPASLASVHPGEPQRPTGAPSPKGPDRSTNPPVPSTSEKTGESSAVTSHAAGDPVQPLQGGHDRQVRGAGCGEDGQGAPAAKSGGQSDNPRRNTQPTRLPEAEPLSLLPEPDPESWAA